MGAEEELQRVALLRDLGSMGRVPVGTRVHVKEDGFIYAGIGQTTPEIIDRIGWDQANVWMPERVETGVLIEHGVVPDPVLAAHAVLVGALSVHEDRRGRGFVYFVTVAERLRVVELLTSRSTDFVDGVVELRHVLDGRLLRFFHLAPADRNKGGRQLWP